MSLLNFITAPSVLPNDVRGKEFDLNTYNGLAWQNVYALLCCMVGYYSFSSFESCKRGASYIRNDSNPAENVLHGLNLTVTGSQTQTALV
jgi:hypothetical protein